MDHKGNGYTAEGNGYTAEGNGYTARGTEGNGYTAEGNGYTAGGERLYSRGERLYSRRTVIQQKNRKIKQILGLIPASTGCAWNKDPPASGGSLFQPPLVAPGIPGTLRYGRYGPVPGIPDALTQGAWYSRRNRLRLE